MLPVLRKRLPPLPAINSLLQHTATAIAEADTPAAATRTQLSALWNDMRSEQSAAALDDSAEVTFWSALWVLC